MARSSILDFRVLIVPGLHGSGPGHWQSRWQRLYPFFERVEQAQWDVPDLDAWAQRLDDALSASSQPTLIVAHSFGCLTTVHCAGRANASPIAGALLVAPADPRKFRVTDRLSEVKLPFPSIVVGSTNDPWMESRRASRWASVWGSEFVNVGALGHINAESGINDWEHGLFCFNVLPPPRLPSAMQNPYAYAARLPAFSNTASDQAVAACMAPSGRLYALNDYGNAKKVVLFITT